jgi:hypothetical protein
MCFFTLEEFLEKYPYKLNDLVLCDDRIYGAVTKMEWDCEKSDMKYYISFKISDYNKWYSSKNIKCKCMEDNKLFGTLNNPLETKSYAVGLKDGKVIDNSIDASQFMQLGKIFAVCFNTENYENEVELKLGDYEIVVRDGKTYAVLKKSKYPTTYAECCEVLVGRKPKPNEISFDKMELCLVDLDNTQSIDFQNPYLPQFNSLFRLRMCRDAYWKIAGEEMGLGKSWDATYGCGEWGYWLGYSIIENKIFLQDSRILVNHTWVFPSAEMRDAFYENFKDLIEQCKELL